MTPLGRWRRLRTLDPVSTPPAAPSRAPLWLRLWHVHLLALVLVAAAGWLGVWQYDAWQLRRAAEATDLTALEPVPLDSVLGPDDPFPGNRVGQPVILGGTWLPAGTIYVSGREQDGTEGYWVVTPLAIPGPDDPAIAVVRGWVDSPEAAPSPPRGRAEVVGWLQPPEGTGQVDPDRSDDVLPQLRIADLIQRVDQDLYGAYAVLTDAAGGSGTAETSNPGNAGLVPAALEQLPDAGRFTALRNLLYALEWWVFGAFAGFIWWQHVRDVAQTERVALASAQAPEDQPVPSEP